MATAADAEVILKLYEMRREETLRKSRRFMIFDFQPKTLEELRAVSRDVGSQYNPAWRHTAALIAKYPVAQKLHDGFLKSLGIKS